MTPEGKIKKEIMDWLDIHAFVYVRVQPIQIGGNHFVPVRPSQEGAPDLFIFPKFGRAKFLAVEAKAPEGKISPAQRLWALRIKAVGGTHMFAYSLSEVIKMLEAL
jgi:hypothetical protein